MIKIPEELSKILEKNCSCELAVKQTMKSVAPILEDNKMEFFPEYTNHGKSHIESVLSIASKIIERETYSLLEAVDVEVLINAIFLHDLGMHISYAGFMKLISDNTFNDANVYNDLPWSVLWKNYFKEAVKWGQEKRKSIFGEYVEINQIPKDERYANKIDKLLIGEFLRRYHHKLAFDIAMYGFPGDGKNVKCLEVSNESLRKIVAHIARSHGMDLWKVVDLMKEEYDTPRSVHNVKLIYIMSILRISDYFDIDKSRANRIIWNLKKLDSGISFMEWEQHNCIEGIDFDYQDDEESLYIRIIKPNSSYMFLKIKTFIENLQNELDTTWAVIGKVYSRYGQFKLRFRRIYSNLSKIQEKVNYVTEKVMFDVNKDILLYLAQPLYGGNPSYGVRELLQNATDACKERTVLDKGNYCPMVQVTIKEENNKKYFIIRDNGTGMTKETIIKYFLVAGSSFRDNSGWKERFVVENKNIVIRNGKFGIGVIAAFLLGEKIEVKTTSMDERITYYFSTSLITKQIELTYKEKLDAEIGTEIKIELADAVYQLLKKQWNEGWDKWANYYYTDINVPWFEWYKLSDIRISIDVPEDWINNSISYDERTWNEFSTDDYESIKWSYDKVTSRYGLLCNGIIIPEAYRLKSYDFPASFRQPLVSVIDRKGIFPLNLSRNSLEESRLPFEKEIVKRVYKDVLEKLENSEDICELLSDRLIIREGTLKHPSIEEAYSYSEMYGIKPEDIIYNENGYCLCYNHCLEHLKENRITKVWVENSLDITEKSLLSILGDNVMVTSRNLPSSIDSYKICLDSNNILKLGEEYKFSPLFIIMKKNKYKFLFEQGKNRMRRGLVEALEVLSESDEFICLGRKGIQQEIDVNKIKGLNNIHLIVQYEFSKLDYYEEAIQYSKYDVFNNVLKERYGENVWIPYHH